MKQKCNATTRTEGSRPLKILAVGIAVTAPALVLIGWSALSTRQAVTHFVTHEPRLQEIRGTILRSDGALTMSASMAAATGNDGRGKRYRQYEPALTALGTEITERKRAEEALRQSMNRLKQFNRLAVGREHQMIELKHQINELAAELGQSPPHDLSFLQTAGGPGGQDGA